MKIEITDGCVCAGMDIDGIPISEMSEDQRHEVRKALCEYIMKDETISLFELAKFACANADSEYSYSDPCECCGDCIETWKIEI